MADKLTAKQQAFINEYIVDFNGTQAAVRAGYSEKTARTTAAEYLAKPNIRAAVDRLLDDRLKLASIRAESVLMHLDEVRLDAMQHVVDRDGNDVMLDRASAIKTLELLGKHLGMWRDKVELTGKDGGAIETKATKDLTDEELAAELAKYGITDKPSEA